MSSNPTVTASYTVASEPTTDVSSTSSEVLTFESPIMLAADKDVSPTQAQKEQYLNALAIALSTLQESINSGLTERLVMQGVLSELGSDKADPSVNNKLRTKVPGQPNNSKKAQAKKQKQQQKQQQQGKQTENAMNVERSDSVQPGEGTITITPASESAALSSNLAASTDVDMEGPVEQDQVQNQDQDFDQTYKPKGGIYGDDDEDEDSQPKDEVDLVMEADPGEVDGACLELPKEQEQLQINKKRNGLSSSSAADLAAAKKPKGSGDK